MVNSLQRACVGRDHRPNIGPRTTVRTMVKLGMIQENLVRSKVRAAPSPTRTCTFAYQQLIGSSRILSELVRLDMYDEISMLVLPLSPLAEQVEFPGRQERLARLLPRADGVRAGSRHSPHLLERTFASV